MTAAARPPAGLLLTRGDADHTARWAAGGLTELGVAPLEGGWCALVPVADTAAVSKPYDDAMTLLLNRPVPRRLRPAIGFALVGDQALVVVVPNRLRPVRRWLVWQPGVGLVRPGALPAAGIPDLVRVAGSVDRAAVAAVTDVVRQPTGRARSVLGDVLSALGLPGRSLLDGTDRAAELPGGCDVEPSPSRVSLFQRMVHEDTSWRDEMEGQR